MRKFLLELYDINFKYIFRIVIIFIFFMYYIGGNKLFMFFFYKLSIKYYIFCYLVVKKIY